MTYHRSAFSTGALVIAALLAPTAAFANEASDSESLVRAEFSTGKPGTGLLMSSKAGISLAEVCFDSCDTFQWKGDIKRPQAWDFIALFEYKIGVASASDVYRNNGRRLSAALQRASQFCAPKASNPPDFECDWPNYSKALAMRVGVASYDEGLRCAGWRDGASMAFPKKTRCGPIRRSPWKQ